MSVVKRSGVNGAQYEEPARPVSRVELAWSGHEQRPKPLRGQLTVAMLSPEAHAHLTGDDPSASAAIPTRVDRPVARVELAWASDADEPKPLRGHPHCTGDDAGALAEAPTGKELFVGPERVPHGTSSQLDEDTLAHELDSLPSWLEEGKAVVLGDAWGADARRLAAAAHTMTSLTADDAAYLLRSFRHPSAERRPPAFVYAAQTTGALFVEFLAAYVKQDTVVRLCAAIGATGRGARFTAAIRRSFGLSLADAEHRFLTFLRDTERQPARRLAGTLYAAR